MAAALRSAQSKTAAIASSEKVKTTLMKKFKDYWKNLYIDYQQMLKELRTDIQDEPQKAIKYTIGLGIAGLLIKNNPSEIDFKANLKNLENEMILVHEDSLNPTSIDHVRFLQTCYNHGKLHYRSLGLFSVMYTSEYNDNCSLYKSQCSYLQPTIFSWPLKIVDVGLMGRWWNVYIKTTDYDVIWILTCLLHI